MGISRVTHPGQDSLVNQQQEEARQEQLECPLQPSAMSALTQSRESVLRV